MAAPFRLSSKSFMGGVISREELVAALSCHVLRDGVHPDGHLLVIDTRPNFKFAQRHIRGPVVNIDHDFLDLW